MPVTAAARDTATQRCDWTDGRTEGATRLGETQRSVVCSGHSSLSLFLCAPLHEGRVAAVYRLGFKMWDTKYGRRLVQRDVMIRPWDGKGAAGGRVTGSVLMDVTPAVEEAGEGGNMAVFVRTAVLGTASRGGNKAGRLVQCLAVVERQAFLSAGEQQRLREAVSALMRKRASGKQWEALGREYGVQRMNLYVEETECSSLHHGSHVTEIEDSLEVVRRTFSGGNGETGLFLIVGYNLPSSEGGFLSLHSIVCSEDAVAEAGEAREGGHGVHAGGAAEIK
jgi:hypothetical protein